MGNHLATMDRVFAALADPTRRAIVHRLKSGPSTVKQLAEPFAMALPSVMKHLSVLSSAGLVTSSKHGRVRVCTLDASALDESSRWVDEHRLAWNTRLTSLEIALTEQQEDGESNER